MINECISNDIGFGGQLLFFFFLSFLLVPLCLGGESLCLKSLKYLGVILGGILGGTETQKFLS